MDNWVRGGLSAKVDLNVGTLGHAAGSATKGKRVWHESHPDTGARIAGVQVPGWEEIRRVVTEGARALSFVPYIAWDVIASDTGPPTVIEGNHFTSVDVFQVHEPLLDNSTLRAFYEEHGVLRGRAT